ncbi:radical SAM protein [Sphingomonas sp. UV9]|uniref:radical SAM protein n=1 Tax=Sphingomonas sp. UV9 TaxID=1851410 RepID=UPI0013E8CFB8|nr:radical SAM protein [Sphingomonas sp. UV9]
MVRHQVPIQPEAFPEIPVRSRRILRYRREAFGWLAAYPDGRIALFRDEAGPLLAQGAPFAAVTPYLLDRIDVTTDFHFAAPVMAWLEITRRCNLRCPHCFVEGGVARNGELSTAEILALLDGWADMGVFSVIITGGEPSIHRDFVRIVNHAHALGFVVGVATNAMPLTRKLLDRLPRTDMVISVSIDGLHGQGAARGMSDFDFATRRIREIQEAGFNTSIMTTTHHGNVSEQHRIIAWARENGVALRSVPFVEMGRGANNVDLAARTEDVELAASFWIEEELWEREHDSVLGLSASRAFNFLLTMVYATRRCMSGRGLTYVTSNGDVFPCSTCAGNKVLCAGNLHMSSFAEIWNGAWDIRDITWDNFRTACQGCSLNADKYFCTSRCPGSSSILNRKLDGCGATEFQKRSTLRREELFRERVMANPAVYIRPEHEAAVTATETAS